MLRTSSIVLLAALMLAACGGRSELPVWGCGDGVVADDEQCDLGDDNEDRPAILLTHQQRKRLVMPLDRSRDVVSFYAYSSESSHTGFEQSDLATLMLYRDTASWTATGDNTLSLVFHMGVDEDTTGVTLDHGRVDISIAPLPPNVSIAVADEEDELRRVGDDGVAGEFEFWRNTDGGALAGLPFPGNWSIDIRVVFRDGIRRWSYVLDDGSEIALDPSFVANLSTFDTPSRCRTDCSLPRCGDSIVDGGEVCDDGNTLSGDGCAADCRSL